MLETLARASQRAGATVISQVRYKFGSDSPPGFAAVVVLDESHCSVHTYADDGLMAFDIFTCGKTDPLDILKYIRAEIDLGDVDVNKVRRFDMVKPPSSTRHARGATRSVNAPV